MRARPDGCRDEPDPEAAIPDPRQGDEPLPAPCAWDASDDVRRGAAAGPHLLPRPADADAEKWVARERDVRARAARFQLHLLVRQARLGAAELCIPGEVRSAAQSCAEPVAEAPPLRAVKPDSAQPMEVAARQMPQLPARARAARALPLEVARLDAAARPTGQPMAVQRESREQRASPLREQRRQVSLEGQAQPEAHAESVLPLVAQRQVLLLPLAEPGARELRLPSAG